MCDPMAHAVRTFRRVDMTGHDGPTYTGLPAGEKHHVSRWKQQVHLWSTGFHRLFSEVLFWEVWMIS